MRTYLISYDLANPNAKKRALAEIIMGLGDKWARPLEQTWYVSSDESADEIEARMSWLLGDEDGLLVQAIGEGSALSNTSLRWFRRRGGVGPAAAAQMAASDETVVAFPGREAPLAA